METKPSARIEIGSLEDLLPVYQQMEQQFPPTELYGYKNVLRLIQQKRYRLLLFRRDDDGTLIGYALVFVSEESRMLWLDYLAVLPQFQGQGWGGAFFTALWQKYCGPFEGMMFSVEYVCDDDEKLATQQRARLSFYKKMGAFPLHARFILPNKDGGLPMYLYFKPHTGLTHLSGTAQVHTLYDMYDNCFSFMKDRLEYLSRFKKTIQDEVFSGH